MTRRMSYTDKLRLARFERRLPQWRVAQELGISQSSYQVYEAGIRPVPEKYQAKLIEILGLRQSFFDQVGGKHEKAVSANE